MNLFRLFIIINTSLLVSCKLIKPEAPLAVKEPPHSTTSIVSNINIPIEIDLNPYFKLAEQTVNPLYEGNDNTCEGLRYYYKFIRSPFNISGNNDMINLSFEGKYQIKGNYCAKCFNNRCLVPSPTFSCGFDEPLRRMSIGYTSKLRLLPNYHLQSNTSLTKAEATDKCKISFINIDITEKLMKEVKNQLDILGKNVDEQVRAYDLKPLMKEIWNKLFEVQKVEDLGYLSLNPSSISINDIRLHGSLLNLELGLTCNPMFSVGKMESKPTKLPDLSNNTFQNGFSVYTDIVADYNDLTELLNSKLIGYIFEVNRKKIIITNLKIEGIGNSRISLKVDFNGSKKGTIYFVGTPNFNDLKNTLTIPDLSFELKSKNILMKMASWLLNDKITDKIKSVAIFDLTAMINDAKNNLQNQLNRNLTDNVQMKGLVNNLSLEHISTNSDAMLLRLLSSGELSIQIK